MFPFANPLRWLLSSRYQHLAEATKTLEEGLSGELLQRVRRRRVGLERWGRVRLAVLVLLYFGLIVSAVGWMLHFLPVLADEAEAAASQAAAWASAGAGLLALGFLVVTRVLGQLEIDILASLLLHHEERLQRMRAEP